MKYTKENINGVIFKSGSYKYKVVYPGTNGMECDLYHFSSKRTMAWGTIDHFNGLVLSKSFKVVEEPITETYSIY